MFTAVKILQTHQFIKPLKASGPQKKLTAFQGLLIDARISHVDLPPCRRKRSHVELLHFHEFTLKYLFMWFEQE